MTATKTVLPALPSLSKTAMEDRKRSLMNDVEDLVPSRKRLKDENGATMRMDEDKEKQVEVRASSLSQRAFHATHPLIRCHTGLPERRHHTAAEGVQAPEARC